MIDDFFRLIEGRFCNKIQAMSYPSHFAMINITHVNIGNGLIYGEQAYNYSPQRPYRQFVLQPTEHEGNIKVLNYKLKDPLEFVNCRNIETLSFNDLQLADGCEVMMYQKSEKRFVGGVTGCDCIIEREGRKTYLQNEIELTATHYYVMDKGFCAQHGHQLWGSKYGRFEFVRMPE